MPAPKTALLVPCYNASRYLERLSAQVAQLRPAFDEVRLADDASQDDTASRAEALGFTVLRLPSNRGPGAARNALARATQAEWIHFHDVDDEIAPDYVARAGSLATVDCDAVLHFTDFIDEDSRALLVRWEFEAEALRRDPARTLLAKPLPTMSSFLRRTRFLELGGFDEQRRCFEDGDFHFRLAASGARLAVVCEVLEHSLRHPGGAGADQHYCARCRLEFLAAYAATHPRLHATIATEAERTAVQLLDFDDLTNARRATKLCSDLGHPAPTSANLGIRLLRPLAPATSLLRWQKRWRALHRS